MILLPRTINIHIKLSPKCLNYFFHTIASPGTLTSNSNSETTVMQQADLFPKTLNPPSGDTARKSLWQIKCPVCTQKFSPKTVPGYRQYLCSLECVDQHKRDLKLYLEAKFTQRCKTIQTLRAFAQSQSNSKPNPTRQRKKAAAKTVVPSSTPARTRKKFKPQSGSDGE